MAKAKAKAETETENEQVTCWLCGKDGADTIINVACETPGGIKTDPHDVKVHFECYMNIDY